MILCYSGAWQLGAPLVAMGLSNVADAISQGTGHGSFNPVREGGEALYRNVFGATPEEAAILWSWTELSVDVAGGICAVSYLRGRSGATTGRATGQRHHAISKKIHTELQKHPKLRGLYKLRDPRFVTRAANLEAHNGYQTWHRIYDNRVTAWLRDNQGATPQQFEKYLRGIYREPGMRSRFPNGL